MANLFALIRRTPNLIWLLLTKRIGNAARMAEAAGGLPENVWLGATVVSQTEADRDVPKLLATAASKRFLSMEPLLGPVKLTNMPCGARDAGAAGWSALWKEEPFGRGHLDWIIVGGESGSGARPMHPDWARSLRDQCAAAGVPFLFKQWGGWAFADYDSCEATHWFGPAGLRDRHGHAAVWERGDVSALRVAKKAAGRLLDGVQHDGMPAVA